MHYSPLGHLSRRLLSTVLVLAKPTRGNSPFQSEQNGFSQFHLYICAAFLVRFSKDLLRERDFQVSTPATTPMPFHRARRRLFVGPASPPPKPTHAFVDKQRHQYSNRRSVSIESDVRQRAETFIELANSARPSLPRLESRSFIITLGYSTW